MLRAQHAEPRRRRPTKTAQCSCMEVHETGANADVDSGLPSARLGPPDQRGARDELPQREAGAQETVLLKPVEHTAVPAAPQAPSLEMSLLPEDLGEAVAYHQHAAEREKLPSDVHESPARRSRRGTRVSFMLGAGGRFRFEATA